MSTSLDASASSVAPPALAVLGRQAAVATITLNRPDRHNSLVPELFHDLLAAVEAVAADDSIGAVVLAANGRSFSTGGDVRRFAERAAAGDLRAYAHHLVGQLNETILALLRLPIPVVAAVQGTVTGGALGLVLASDCVLLAPEATFRPWYTTVGFSPDGGWTALLPHRIGPLRATGMLLSDAGIDAATAVSWGLATRVVPSDEVLPTATDQAGRLAERNPGAVRRAKRLLVPDIDRVAADLERERQEFVEQILTTEARTGMAAFLTGSRS